MIDLTNVTYDYINKRYESIKEYFQRDFNLAGFTIGLSRVYEEITVVLMKDLAVDELLFQTVLRLRKNGFNEYRRVGSGGYDYAWLFVKGYASFNTRLNVFVNALTGMYNDDIREWNLQKIIEDNIKIVEDAKAELNRRIFLQATGTPDDEITSANRSFSKT